MVSKSRKLISGLLSALLVGGSASAGFVGSAAGAAKSAITLPLNVAGKVVGTAVGVVGLAAAGYTAYLSYCIWNKVLDGSLGFYCFSEKELSSIFDDALREYNPNKDKAGIFGYLVGGAKFVRAAASGFATKLDQLSGVEVVEKNVSLRSVVSDYLKTFKELPKRSNSEVVVDAVRSKLSIDSKRGDIKGYYAYLSELFWVSLINTREFFSESCFDELVKLAWNDAKPVKN